MKIIFIGAGMASLVASRRLAEAGFDVSVYEKQSYDNLTYDWHDDVNAHAFLDNNLPLPKEGTYFTKRNWTFVPPSQRIEITLDIPESELDLSIERRPLAHQYVERAKDIVKFHFDSEVQSLVLNDGKVCGVKVGGEDILADIVVDNSGAKSIFRGMLPKESKIISQPNQDEIFVAYRAFHKKVEGVKDPQNTNRAYLKHIGEKGISWSILDPANTVNILIGRAGEMSQQTLDNAYKQLKVANPEISDEVVRGGRICTIPIRFPLCRMVWDGYVAIGDSAFMTIPMIGSGIENSINAAIILADTIIQTGSSKKEDLWGYQVEYFVTRGANHIGVDILKRWLLDADAKDVDFLFERSVVERGDMARAATGELVKLGVCDLLKRAVRGIRRLPLLLKMAVMLEKTKKAARIGKKIPKTYDEQAIDKWSAKIEKLVY